MSVSQIVRHFEGLGKVPVAIDDVLTQVQSFAGDERIRVRGVDEDFSELKAAIVRFRVEDGTSYMVPVMCSEIIYSTRMPLPWQRLACCKEMIHVIDPNPVCTSSKEEVLALAENMAKSIRPTVTSPNGLQTLTDQLAKWQAVAVLFPYGFWEELYPKYEKGIVSCGQISEWLQIPEEAVRATMSPTWGHLRQTILAFS